MAKTLAEARQEVLAAGYQGEPTPEILRQHGWEPSDDTKAVLTVALNAPARTPQQVKDDLALLYEEAKRNSASTDMLSMITKVAGTVLKFV